MLSFLGYCAWHHLLLALCNRMPELRQEINRRVDSFLGGATSKVRLFPFFSSRGFLNTP